MGIILRNSKNMFCKEQKIVTDEYLKRHDNTKWGTVNPDNRTIVIDDKERKRYKVVYN